RGTPLARRAPVRSDIRLAFRSGVKSPGFVLTAVASIGLGIGASTAMFTLVDQLLRRAPPVRNPRELVPVSFAGARPTPHRRRGADPGAVGRSLAINGHPYTIVGVAQEGFDGIELGRRTQVFVPMMMKAQVTPGWNALDERLYRWVRVFGRLRPGVTSEQARN